jgi:hypothetical protein
MILKNTYLIGTQVQFYEIEMLEEHLRSCQQMLEGIENKENVTFRFLLNFQQHYEKIDWETFLTEYNLHDAFAKIKTEQQKSGFYCSPDEDVLMVLFKNKFEDLIYDCSIFKGLSDDLIPSSKNKCKLRIDIKTTDQPFYNIADFRRDLAWEGCRTHDFVMFGETDSLWSKQTLFALETLHEQVSGQYPKYVANFAGRKNWDKSWDVITHPLFESIPYQDNEDWIFNNPASEKSYMSLEQMNEINDISPDKIQVQALTEPKADGSCLVFTSELLKSGVTLPHSLILHGEDESILRIAKRIMGDEFVQFNFKNILRVHNRRHPQKRKFILNEDNPTGICNAEKKGQWWVELEEKSKHNLETLFKQVKSKSL